jgi:hypothetical protein
LALTPRNSGGMEGHQITSLVGEEISIIDLEQVVDFLIV